MNQRVKTKRSTRRSRPQQHRFLRGLDGRAFATEDDRLFLATGQPDAKRLLEAMTSFWPFDSVCDPSLLRRSGFRHGDLQEVTPHVLSRFHRAISSLKDGAAVPSAARTEHFQSRLKQLQCWHRTILPGKFRETSPLLLSEDAARELELAVSRVLKDGYLPGLESMARAVLWLSGTKALKRFLHCLAPHVPGKETWADSHDWKRLLAELRSLRKRYPNNTKQVRSGIRIGLQQAVGRLPPEFATRNNITVPSRDDFAISTLDGLLKRARKAVQQSVSPPSRRMIAAVGALCATDGARTPPSPALFLAELQSDPQSTRKLDTQCFSERIAALIEECRKEGYEELLAAIGKTEQPIHSAQLSTCRRILASGGSIADIDWLSECGLMCDWHSRDLAPTSMRELVQLVARWDIYFSTDEMETLCESIQCVHDLAPYELAVRWLKRFPPHALQSGIVQHFKSTFLFAATATTLRPQLRSFLPQWVVPPKTRCPQVLADADTELKHWLKLLAWYQRLASRRPALPKAVRKTNDAAGRELTELNWLQTQRRTGNWNDSLESRFHNLQQREQSTRLRSQKLVRTTARATAVAGVQVLQDKVEQFSKQWWQSRFDSLENELKHRERMEICAWVGRLCAADAELFDTIVSRWKVYGAGFKSELPFNRDWLRQARSRGLNTELWLRPRTSREKTLTGTEFEISIEPDPFHVFLMGSRFETCLNLRTGFNHRSVLANASHANKAVLHVRDNDGAIVGRKLLAISCAGSLLGYHTYCHLNRGAERTSLLSVISGFCGSFARDLRIPLADDGFPDDIADHFWYDDEPERWTSTARWYWHFPRRPTQDPDSSVEFATNVQTTRTAHPHVLLGL